MARKPLIAGNWKMNLNHLEAVATVQKLAFALPKEYYEKVDVAVTVPFTDIRSVQTVVEGDKLSITYGAQDVSQHESGAYTGEVSAAMVASTGAKYCIIGHSERRTYYGETYEILRLKVRLALENGLRPIFCIGETKDERQAGRQNDVVQAQLEGSVFDLTADEFGKIVLAYEPVWAIGTGLTATSDQAQEMHAFIRSLINKKYGKELSENTSILYGGSCNPSNAKELFAKPDVDGGLIGGASLKAVDFVAIIDSF